MLNWLQTGLFLHMIGLATVAGVTLASYFILRQFRVQYTQDKQKGFAIMQATSKLPMVAGIGLLLQILSGIVMMVATRGAFGEQLWFQIKMIFVILIIASIIILNGQLQKRLRKWVLDDLMHGKRTQQIGSLAEKIGYIQLFLLSFFIIVFMLSVFRFN